MHTTKPRKLALGAVALLGIGSAAGLGLARYTESGAFAFYKQPRADFSRPYATPVTISTGPMIAAPTEPLIAAPSVAPQSYLTEATDIAPIAESEPLPAEEDSEAVRTPEVQPAAARDTGPETVSDAAAEAAAPSEDGATVAEANGYATEHGREVSSPTP